MLATEIDMPINAKTNLDPASSKISMANDAFLAFRALYNLCLFARAHPWAGISAVHLNQAYYLFNPLNPRT